MEIQFLQTTTQPFASQIMRRGIWRERGEPARVEKQLRNGRWKNKKGPGTVPSPKYRCLLAMNAACEQNQKSSIEGLPWYQAIIFKTK